MKDAAFENAVKTWHFVEDTLKNPHAVFDLCRCGCLSVNEHLGKFTLNAVALMAGKPWKYEGHRCTEVVKGEMR
jgi:hypothetical protein